MSNSYANWCRHYTGLMQDTCAADIRYDEVKDATRRGLAQYPCFKDEGCPWRCTSASFLSPEEVAEKMQEAAKALQHYTNNLKYGMCPHCHRRIEEKKQVGRCVYALPCNHRLYQGILPKKEKSLEDHPFFREQRKAEATDE